MLDGKALAIESPQSGTVVIRTYSLRGELLAKPFESFLSAGSHRIALSALFNETHVNKPIALNILINGVMTNPVMIMNIKGK